MAEVSACLLIEDSEELGQGSQAGLVERCQRAGVLNEVMPEGRAKLLAFRDKHQRLDATIDRIRAPFDRSASLETVDEGREVGGVVVETLCETAHRHRHARDEAQENLHLSARQPEGGRMPGLTSPRRTARDLRDLRTCMRSPTSASLRLSTREAMITGISRRPRHFGLTQWRPHRDQLRA